MAVESSKSDSSEHLSFESEQKKGTGFLSPSFPTPSSRSLLNMQIQQRMRLLAGGHVRTSFTNSWKRPTVQETQR
ncbi:hypothetical protein NQZ68_015734, partial [Dissostichus eleginoides]